MLERERSGEDLNQKWNQGTTPIVLRRGGKGERLRVRVPNIKNEYEWLKNGRRTKPTWNEKHNCWELPKAWFNDFVERALRRYNQVYVVQPYREMEVCAAACMNATGHECQCSCMGANHGAGNDGSWFEVEDYFAARWGDRRLACRLMVALERA